LNTKVNSGVISELEFALTFNSMIIEEFPDRLNYILIFKIEFTMTFNGVIKLLKKTLTPQKGNAILIT